MSVRAIGVDVLKAETAQVRGGRADTQIHLGCDDIALRFYRHIRRPEKPAFVQFAKALAVGCRAFFIPQRPVGGIQRTQSLDFFGKTDAVEYPVDSFAGLGVVGDVALLDVG